MACKLPALRSTLARQFHAGNALILIIAVWMFLPYTLDRIRGEPSMRADLTYMVINGIEFIDDDVTLKYPTSGTRVNTLQDLKGRILCQKQVTSVWEENKYLVWYLKAFVGCEPPTDQAYKVCSYFAIHSRGGIERKVGANNAYCTKDIQPLVKEKT